MSPFFRSRHLLLLVGDSTTTTTSRTGVLATSTKLPVVTKTTVGTNLLQALQVVTQLSLDIVRQNLRVLARGEVLLPVKEPGGNLELLRRLKDVDDALKLIRVEFTSTESVSTPFTYVPEDESRYT